MNFKRNATHGRRNMFTTPFSVTGGLAGANLWTDWLVTAWRCRTAVFFSAPRNYFLRLPVLIRIDVSFPGSVPDIYETDKPDEVSLVITTGCGMYPSVFQRSCDDKQLRVVVRFCSSTTHKDQAHSPPPTLRHALRLYSSCTHACTQTLNNHRYDSLLLFVAGILWQCRCAE